MLGVMLIALVGAMLAIIAVGGNLVICHARARSASDLAATSAATVLLQGNAAPCATAQDVASRSGAVVASCDIDGEDVIVAVNVATGVPFLPQAGANARAGPVACE